MLMRLPELLMQPLIWRVVGFTSSVVGLICYALSSSFTHLFGKWNLLKIFIYSLVSFIICSFMLFAKKWKLSRNLLVKTHFGFLVLMVTSLYSFFYDKAVNGKPDLYSLISCAAFAAMSLSLSRQTEIGFELDLLNFFLGCLTLQLMKINLMLAFIGVAFSYCLILLRSSLDSQMEIGEASARISDHVAVDVDSSTSNQAQQELSIQEGTTKQDRFSSGKSEVKDEIASMQSYSVEIANVQTNHNSGFQSESLSRVPNDGYNWRKYGQKQAKGNENSISYYKCTYINCQTKRKIVRSLDGKIIEIVYRGTHNHPEPQATMRNSSSASNPVTAEIPDHAFASHGNGQMDSVAISESSSITMGDDDFVQSSQKNRSGLDGFDAQRLKVEGENEGISAPGSRTVREPRVVVKTTSDVDYLDDGYIWRKYAQKVVKANPIPRSYYKCRHPGCPVRKQVEIASHDPRAVVITTYEGKHNHDAPAAQGSESHSVNRPLPNKHSAITHNTNNSINTSLQSFRAAEGQSTFTLEDSSLSTGEEDFRRSFEKSNKSGGDE